MRFTDRAGGIAVLLCAALSPIEAQATQLQVTITNIGPTGGVGLSPLWVGFHNGSFNSFNVGGTASLGLESVAEDGDTTAISNLFAASTPGGVQGTLGPPIFPGVTRSGIFDVDVTGAGRYFSYASMVVVSNDFFIANDTPTETDLSVLLSGQTLSLIVGQPFGPGNEDIVYDAGTEVNDFATSLANGAFGIPGGQTGPNQGTTQGGVITAVQGNPFANFLNQPLNQNLDLLNFNNPALYQGIARIDISVVPEPASLLLLAGGLVALAASRGRRPRSLQLAM